MAALHPFHPAEIEVALGDRDPDRPRDVWASLGPIEARPAQLAAPRTQCGKPDPELGEETGAGCDALSLDLQGKVLAAINSGLVRRLGGGDARALDVRVIAATHADLADLVRRGMFRADLLDRFARSTLILLPLRERPDDILPLARHFAARLAQRQGEVRRLTSDAEEQLKGYRWPGNVRELSAVIERAVMRRSREEIGVEELGLPSI